MRQIAFLQQALHHPAPGSLGCGGNKSGPSLVRTQVTDDPAVHVDQIGIAALQAPLERVHVYFGSIRVLVNNAGRDDRHSLDELTPEISWMRGRPNLIGYTSAKAAISGMTRSLARELGEHGIRVIALVPGAIATARQNELLRNADEDKKFIELQCLKFRLDASHVARPTLFLASDDSDGITAKNLIVGAGLAQVSVAG